MNNQPTIVDRVVNYFDPMRGLERARARTALSLVQGQSSGGGGYFGGWRDRRATRTWRPLNASADADALPDLPYLRARSRDLVRNQPIATGAVATTVTNVVGDGLQLQASIDAEALGLTAEQADAWEQAAEREWCHFCRTADFSRVQCFEELQALALRSVLESGDLFIVRRYRLDPGDVYGTKLQLLEADRVSNPNKVPDNDRLAGGVETDQDGVPRAYWITDRHPGAWRALDPKWQRIESRTSDGLQTVLHLYDRLRPELSRGVPYLATVIEHLKLASTYSEAEVSAAVLSAMIVGFTKSSVDQRVSPLVGQNGGTGGGSANLAANEASIGQLALVDLRQGEEVQFPQPGRPNAQFDAFMQAFLRQVGVALELPFELLVKHFTASYSASRAALEMAWQFFRKRRTWLARNLCQVVYEWMIAEAVATGRLVAPGYFADPMIAQAYCQAEWMGPSRPSIDPLKEAKADEVDVGLGTKTREQICMERTGGEFERKAKQLVKEHAALVDALPAEQRASSRTVGDIVADDVGAREDETQPQRGEA